MGYMKAIITLITIVFTLPGAFVFADNYETLAGYRDSIEVSAGEVALVLFATDSPTLQYTKKGRYPVQFRLGDTDYNNPYRRRSGRNKNTLSAEQPLALVGPSKIALMTDGVVSIRIISVKGGR